MNGCGHSGQIIGSEELVGRGLEGAVLIALDIDQTLRSYLGTFYPLCQLVGLLAGVAGTSGHRNTAHILCRIEDRETVALCQRGNLVQLHAEADIGLVRAV